MVIYIDTNNACNLRCRGCTRGMGLMESSEDVMELGMFEQIIQKATNENILSIELYNWSEPFLNHNIVEYVKIVRKYGLQCGLSTNLSLQHIPQLDEVLVNIEDGTFYVSVSGDDNETHQIYHMGSDINIVYRHLQKIAELKKADKIKTNVVIKFLDFGYNRQCKDKLQTYAEISGFGFKHVFGYGVPKNVDRKKYASSEERKTFFNRSVKTPIGKLRNNKCALISHGITIDHAGNVYLCCGSAFSNLTLIGKYLEMSASEIFANRVLHPLCRQCTHSVGEKFTQEEKSILINAIAPDSDMEVKDAKIVLFGAGFFAGSILNRLLEDGLRAEYIVDNNQNIDEYRHINRLGEVQILDVKSPVVLFDEGTSNLKIIISSFWHVSAIKDQLADMGFAELIIPYA